jgi:F0F1-type ATP synthase assembly protein I
VALQPESRSALAVGVEWAAKVTTIALGFSLPAFIGFGLDRWLGSTPVATFVGIVLGFVSGLLQTIRLASDLPGKKPPGQGRFHQQPKRSLPPEDTTENQDPDSTGAAAP